MRCILCLCLFTAVWNLHAMGKAAVLWEYRLSAGHFDGSPAVGDLLNDGKPEIVGASTAGFLVAIDTTGNEIWRSAELGDFVTVSPTLADVTGDGALEALAVTNSGRVVCVDGQRGTIIWEHDLGATVKWAGTSIVAADITNDGRLEVVLGDTSGVLTCLAADGQVLWTHREPHEFVTSPAVGDLTGDGSLEILAGTLGTPLVCIAANGSVVWRLPEADASETSPVVWDLTGDGHYEVLVGIGRALAATDARGNVLWTHPMEGDIDTAISIADLTGDGSPEIVVVDLTGHVACLNADGSLRWTGDVEQRSRRSPLIADVTGDGALEILIGGYSSAIHLFAPDGELLERLPLGATMNTSPTAIDLRGDGRLSVLAALNSAYMRAYDWGPAAPALAPWPEYRLNSTRTASLQSLEEDAAAVFTEVGFGRQFVGVNTFEAAADNPDGAPVTVRLELMGLSAEPLVTETASSEPRVRAQLRYTLDGQQAHNLAFTATLEQNGRILARRTHRVHMTPFQGEQADLTRVLQGLENKLERLVERERVEERVLLLRHRAGPLLAKTAQASALPLTEQRELRDRLHALLDDCHRWEALVDEALRTGGTAAIHAANPWAPFGGADELVEGRRGEPAVRVDAFGNSVEAAALNVYNFADDTRTFRVELANLILESDDEMSVPARGIIALHEVLDVPTQMLDTSPDALPKLNQAQTLAVPAWDARQLWLSIDTAALPSAGTWTGELQLRALAVGSEPVTIPIELNVWDVEIPAEYALGLCTWAYVHRSVLADQPESALKDQIAHGSSIFTSPFPPSATFDKDGAIVDMDFTEHDAHVLKYGPHGILLLSGYTHALSGPEPHGSDTWRQAHVEYLRRWIAHLKGHGFDYGAYALYPRDEPGLTEGSVDFFMTYAELAKEADPEVRVYANPVGGATMKDLVRMTPYVDIWAPHRHAYMLSVGGEKLEYLKSLDTPLWTYECEANVKHQSPLGYYRAYAWNAWQHGMTAIGFWTYCTSSEDPWFEPAPPNQDYMLIYHGDGVVTTKRWEAVRDAIEDYTLLDELRAAADAATAENRHADAVAEARNLLDSRAKAIAEFNATWWDSHGPGAEGAPNARKRADEKWAVFQQTRRDIARLLGILAD